MRINNNITAINAHRNYTVNNSGIGKNVEKLSSGYRINRAGDDAAGLAISEKMRAQIRGLSMASKNSQDAISLVQTAEGALQESHNILQRMRELAVQSASDTNETVIDRGALQQEFGQLIAELNDTASKAKFNDQGLIDGTFSKAITNATSDKAAVHGLAWANDNVLAGDYTITVQSALVTPAVTGAKGTMTAGTGTASFKLTSVDGAIAATTTYAAAASGKAVLDEKMNGVWNFTASDGKIVATNERTGEQISRDFMAVNGTATTTLDFGALGTLAIKGAASTSILSAESFTAISGKVTITGAVTEQKAEYKHYATMGGDQIELQTGMTTLNFKNSGVSVQLKETISVDNTAVAGSTLKTAVGDGGKISVTKNNGKNLVIQTGANQGDELSINIGKMDAYTLGVAAANIGNRLDASTSITQVNTALNVVSTQRAALGALQNRLDHKIANLDTSSENLQAAESRIRDVDMAKEMTNFTRNNILFQASTAMLAQANALPQGVLQLLG